MKQTIGYSESIEMFNPATGLKRWVKIWRDKEIDNDEDPHRAFEEVKSFVENKFHKDNNQQLDLSTSAGLGTTRWGFPQQTFTNETLTPVGNQPIPSLDRKAIERLEILIDDAKTVEEINKLEEDAIKYGLKNWLYSKRENLDLAERIQRQKQ